MTRRVQVSAGFIFIRRMLICDSDDDGSGVAVAMELARIMATHQPAATIMFAAVAGWSLSFWRPFDAHTLYAGEEQGLFGSDFMARTLKNASADVQGMLNVRSAFVP